MERTLSRGSRLGGRLSSDAPYFTTPTPNVAPGTTHYKRTDRGEWLRCYKPSRTRLSTANSKYVMASEKLKVSRS
jgi:hypothetical protein